MSNPPIPRCPKCGAATKLDVATFETWAKNDVAFRCNQCGEPSPAEDWLKSIKKEGGDDA